MERHAKSISQGNTATEHLGVGVLALCFPLQKVQSIVAACGKAERRVRDLPAALVVYYVIALSLFPGVAYQGVLRWLIGGLQWLDNHRFRIACRESLSDARQRLGDPDELSYEASIEIIKSTQTGPVLLISP